MKSFFNYLEGSSSSVLFNNKTLDFYRIFDPNLKNHLREYFNDGIDSKEVTDILNSTYSENELDYKKRCESKISNLNKRVLEKLTIITTNNCNLQCKYCYANGGNYGKKVEALSYEEAKNIIDYFVDKFDFIRTVFFFGGEPLMNFQVIEYICNYFNQLKNENKIDYIPRFAVITNGTTITDQIIDMLIKYNFTITISIDGDEFIQNYLRIDKLGHGTFNKINEKYKQLIEKGFPKNSIGLECTYTKAHIDKKISFVDLLNYFHTNFGIDIVHIAPVCIDSNNKLSLSNYQDIIINYTKELVDYSFDTILNEKSIKSSSFVLGILDRLISNTQVPYICPAGLNSVSVAKDGIIRPCFVFSGSDISIGNLQSTMDELKDNLKDFTLKYNEKHLYEKCKECYARNVCSSCLTSYGDNLDEPDFYHGADSMCTIMKTMISSILLRLSEIKSNKENWNTLNEVLNKYSTCHYC